VDGRVALQDPLLYNGWQVMAERAGGGKTLSGNYSSETTRKPNGFCSCNPTLKDAARGLELIKNSRII